MLPTVLDYGEVGALSLDLLSSLEANGVPRGIAMAALLLTAMRIMSDRRMEIEEEIAMTTEALEWVWLRVAAIEGEAN